MNFKSTKMYILAALLLCQFQGFSQEELKTTIQIRPRAEYRNGIFTPRLTGQDAANFVSQRNRLGFYYSRDAKLQMGLNFQSVFTWGNEPQIQATANSIGVYEAWFKYNFTPEYSLKSGRQIFSYDDDRILGSLDWNQAGRKHDAVLFGMKREKFRADLGMAFNQNKEMSIGDFYNDSLSQPYKAMQFLWIEGKVSEFITVSALALNLNMQSRTDSLISNLQTVGGNIYYKKAKLKIQGTAYAQMGNKDVKGKPSIKTNAWMAAIKVDYKLNDKIDLGIGSDYLSGKEKDSTNSDITYFNPLYGTHHKFYGTMDYFYVPGINTNGLWDNYISVGYKPDTKTGIVLALHNFRSGAKMLDYSYKEISSELGNEIDITISRNLMDGVKVIGGYSQMLQSESMRFAKNIAVNKGIEGTQNWLWLSLDINPSIFLVKK